MTVPRDVAVGGLAVSVSVADGWNRFTMLPGPPSWAGGVLMLIGVSVPARSSVPTKVVVLRVGSGSLACTVRVTAMSRLRPGARAWLKLNALLMDVTN